MWMLYPIGAGAFLSTLSTGKESYEDPSRYVPWILVALALVLTTMVVRAMSPVLNVLIAGAVLWYAWKDPTVKTMTQNTLQQISSMVPKSAPAPVTKRPALDTE